ncbi:hypothetical protein AAIH70_25365 [Neorhizobium sp. BT27B]|uniref:hypothetical protein n=1 Tax=Neorhizobium sp. BT27B TaxID=3142625 RepID=UPI003D291FE1
MAANSSQRDTVITLLQDKHLLGVRKFDAFTVSAPAKSQESSARNPIKNDPAFGDQGNTPTTDVQNLSKIPERGPLLARATLYEKPFQHLE